MWTASSATEIADNDLDISLLARDQISILAELAGNTAKLAVVEDRKYSDTLTKMITVILPSGRQINIIAGCFVK
jgi:hypothetical protein